MRAALKDLKGYKEIALDTETEGFDRITERICMLPLATPQHCYLIRPKYLMNFKPLLEDENKVKIIHNSLFDCTWLKHEYDISIRNIYDTMNAEKIALGCVLPYRPPAGWTKAKLNAYKPAYSSALEYCLSRRDLPSKFEFTPFVYGEPWTDAQILYSKRDVEYLHQLKWDQERTINMLGLDNVLELENKVAEIMYQMSATGFQIDVPAMTAYNLENKKKYDEAVEKLKEIADLNWGAPGQVCKFFGVKYIKELEAMEPKPDKRKAYEYWQTARSLKKFVDTYGQVWIDKYVRGSTVYCSYTQIINTGRMSCDSPNLQNIPVKNGARFREFFIARKGCSFCIGDFSGQELAIMAIGSGEEVWLETLRAGKDLHAKCGELMSRSAGKDIPRKMAKTLNFTMGYGGSAVTVQARLKNDYDIEITQDEAQDLINIYFRTFPKLKKYLEANGQLGVKHGITYSFEPFNRMRVLAFETENWRKKNIGKNSPIQATGADMTKLAMVYLHNLLKNTKAKIIHQLHDELVVEAPTAQAKEVKKLMIQAMDRACENILGEPISAPDVHLQKDWSKI